MKEKAGVERGGRQEAPQSTQQLSDLVFFFDKEDDDGGDDSVTCKRNKQCIVRSSVRGSFSLQSPFFFFRALEKSVRRSVGPTVTMQGKEEGKRAMMLRRMNVHTQRGSAKNRTHERTLLKHVNLRQRWKSLLTT